MTVTRGWFSCQYAILIINMKQITISGTVTNRNALIRLMIPIRFASRDRLKTMTNPISKPINMPGTDRYRVKGIKTQIYNINSLIPAEM